MKKILTFLMVLISVQLLAQNPNILVTGITIIMPASPDPNTANWGTGTSVFTISASTTVNNLKLAMESKILVTIKKGGSKICGVYTSSNAPASNFNTVNKVWIGNNAVSLLGQDCILKPGEYELCVQFFSPRNTAISEEKCQPFSIRGEEQQTYQPPQLISPADGTMINEADAKKPLTFRWTPVVPKPREPVLYKLRVFEIRQGQTATTAVKSAAPLLSKDITNQTQYVLPSLSQLPVAKGSSYGWYVQAVDQKGNPVGGNNGMSGINTFKIVIIDPSQGCFEIDTTQYDIICTGVNSSGQFIYALSNLLLKNIGSNIGRTGLHNTPQSNVITPSGFTVTNLIPAGGATIGINQTVSLSFNIVGATGSTASFIVHATIVDPVNPNLYCDKNIGVTVDLPPCLCTDCDALQWDFILAPNKISETQYNLQGTLGVVPLSIYEIEFQVQSYSFTPTPSSCSNGITHLEESGMILLPATTINNSAVNPYNETISGSLATNNNATKTVKLTSASPMPNPIQVNLSIGLPGAIPGLAPNCCVINYEVCIKVTVFYDADRCKTCTYIKCFQFTNQ